ncbi:MAG: peptidase, partial [Planctomycetota bacterium]
MPNFFAGSHESNTSESTVHPTKARRSRPRKLRDTRRRQLLETLESRMLLAGPQLIGIQPNEGALIEDGTVRDTSPRVLTFGFDEDQVISAQSFDGIQISRAGADGQLGTNDDISIEPGLITLGDPNQNEVVVRFAESLPDDEYRIEVFAFDDAGLGITGLRNANGELFMPSDPNARSEVVDFRLSLGALIESVVPQPVIRNSDGSLSQNRDEIVVYFNEDPLFVEDDDNGNPTERSAENPRFYQLLLTQETVRTTDDLRFHPETVVYDEATHTARLIFADDINELSGVPLEGGTWRLRIGTAVDDRVDLILPPTQVSVTPSAVTDFQQDGLRVVFASRTLGEAASGVTVRFEDTGAGLLTARLDGDGNVVFDFGGSAPLVQDLIDVVGLTPAVDAILTISVELDGTIGAGADTAVPLSVIGAPPLSLQAAGDTLATSLDVGIFGQDDNITSVILTESIDPQAFDIELRGGNDDPGHRDLTGAARELSRHINPDFGADTLNGVTEIAYNFQGIFDSVGNTSFLNQITESHKTRVREVLNLWSADLGVQFRETLDEGITFAVGDTSNLQSRGLSLIGPTTGPTAGISNTLGASIRIDPTFQQPAVVFSNQTDFALNYGEDFTRKATAAVGFVLGLESASDLPAQTTLALNGPFLNQSIDTPIGQVALEPVFPANYDVIHGQHLHRPDSVDVDLYRFEVKLGDADRVGTVTAETFAERLPDSSLLDTNLALFEEVRATAVSDLGVGSSLGITFTSMTAGSRGNNTEVRFIRTDRAFGDDAVRVNRVFSDAGTPLPNVVLLDLPRAGANITSVPAQDVVDAINDDPFASSIIRAELTLGDPQTDVSINDAPPQPVRLTGGGLTKLTQNDDYFSEDSRLIASLGEGVYYIGVSASGNDAYDPAVADSGFGGRTQGAYDLHIKFEPQVDEVDVIRDLDSPRPGVPGTRLDGDGDGTPGGAHNFWFQTRPLDRVLNFTDNGEAITPGQTLTVESGTGIIRTYEFVPNGNQPTPGNVGVFYSDGSSGFPTPSGNLAAALAAAINTRQGETGVSVARSGTALQFSGDRSVDLSTDFRAATAIGRTLFVDKLAGPNADGSLARPFNSIANNDVANAFGSTLPGDIVRIVGNGGVDGDLSTEVDNFSYQIGISDVGGTALADGRSMEVPQGVTTMIDAGAILKLRGSFIGIGSSTLQVDRSGGALQLLGTPRLVDLSLQGEPITTTLLADENAGPEGYDDGSVIVTSIRDRAAHAVSAGNSPDAAAGDWGGLIFRRDVDQFEGRRDLEDEGIFLQRVNHTEIRYGGSSNVLIDSQQQLVNPILIVNMRPTVTFNEITLSADSAISASPDSFEETSYQAPRFQQAGSFTADYDRVGPEISNNQLADNSVNGLFVRVPTTATQAPRELTVSGRFDDIDIVHVLPENLVIASQPGGSITDGFAPPMALVTGRQLAGGTLNTGTYLYKMTFVDGDGFESLPSTDQFTIATTEDNSSVELAELPRVTPGGAYASRRLYRALDDGSGNPVFNLIAELDASSTAFIDDGSSSDGILDLNREGIRGRLDASLVLDPGTVLKLSGSRVELQPGSVVLAEGDASNPVVFTSLRDDRFGAGGTFDTNNDDGAPTVQPPAHGDWAGIYAGPTSSISLDQAVVSYAGGISLIEGGETRGFVPLQLQQAEGRITNTRFEFNDSGQDGAGPVGRFGRLSVAPSTIFVRGSQPIIVGNTFVDNDGSIIDIDVDSLDGDRRVDIGRQTGAIERFSELDDNYGPLIRYNRYEDNDLPGLNQITGLEIRGGTLTSESVWDDTDIVHLLFDSVIVDNFHSSGGLKLRSRPDESLVVKLTGAGTPNSDTIGTGLTATGTVNDAPGRLGGQISILGLPDAPVVLTSFRDDSVGAGLTPDGSPFTDNNGDKTNSRAEPNDWRSVYLAQNSTDRNVDVIPELELSTEAAPGLNGNIENAQLLGELAGSLTASDEVQRLGFEVEGFLSNPDDVDTYSFIGRPGTEVWIDIDKTTFGLDTVIELLDENGTVLARSDDSGDEIANGSVVDVFDPRLDGVTTSLQARDPQYSRFGAGGVFEDFDTTNPRDAGIHFTLTGNDADPNARSNYFFRVRSASINPDDVSGGLTRGGYRFQVRLTEDQEFAGSVVRFSDIRFANHGIHVQGLLGTSPLLGEAGENEAFVEGDGDRDAFRRDDANNDTLTTVTTVNNGFGLFGLESPQRRPQNLGNLTGNRSNVISVAGELRDAQDVDFYQIDVFNDDILNALRSTVFDVDYAAGFNRPDTNISVFYDPDGEFNDTEQPRLVLYGTDSNVLDDLTSPNGENDDSEKLSRGSIATGDPLIGPVTLVEGTYYVAITADNVEPEVFVTDRFLRREPVNSVRRIVEERYDPLEGFSTASGPVVTEFFTPATLASGGFVQTGDFLPGHGRPAHFDGSFGTLPLNTVFNEFVIAPGDAADIFGGPFRATEVDSLDWSLTDNIEIGGDFFGGGFFSENTSTFIPHVSIDGQLGGDRVDFYEFTVSEQFSRVILDVDHGFNGNTLIDSDDPLTPFTFTDPTSVDTTMYLFREDVDINGIGLGTYQLVNTSLFSDTRDGRLGSDSLNSGSTFDEDPFVDLFLQEGTYVVGVAQEQVAVTVDNNGLPNVANTDPLFGPLDYRLHISVEDHPLPDNGGNQVIHFDRRTAVGPGTITSEPFDLSGYAAEDLPTFYFNSRFAPEVGDSATARIFSDQNSTGRPLNSNFFADDIWQQSREDISDFAGQSGVRVEFTYTPSAVPVAIDDTNITGLYLDDFIVGFAERGETIFNAPGDGTAFVGFGTGGAGEYQLEVRPGTEYSTAGTFAGSTPTTDFDTNDRHNQSITIVAPAGTQIVDGDTFVIGDGSTNRTFEFTTTPGSVEFGNTPVLFSTTDTPAQVAESIRSAITIQSSIDIEASSSGGEDTGALTDGRLALSGSARGSFLAIDSPADSPATLTRDADGNLLIPAILHNGIGDSNFLRTQGQVIIDSNRISDVRAIGIWSEPGIRDIDPEDRRNFDDVFFNNFFVNFNDGIFFGGLDLIDDNHAFLEFPPVGNAYPGVARNLPTLNDSVEGGLAPGIVVTNNTIDNAGFSGVKVDGESAPFVLDIFELSSEFFTDGSLFEGFPGDILEGSLLEIDAGGTRVTFEFDELNGNSTIAPLGSATIGSNGVADGHVPIYYREDPDESSYNRPNNALRIGYSSIELAMSIMGAIQGSSLVTNGLVELVTATLGPSPYRRSRFNEQFQLTNSSYDTAAVYLQGVSNVRWIPGLASTGVDISQAPVAETAQPFARIVNNTIYGSDGRESAFPDANVESNDVIADAIDTKVGPSHRNVYTSTATLGDNDGPVAANGDVDFYQVNLGVGDRLVVDIDSEDIGGADTAVQIFNARGERQSFIQLSSGDVVTLSSEDTTPDYLEPLSTPTNVLADAVNTRDPSIDFFAPEKGTYFVAVSAESNVDFEPDALSGRT